MCSNPNGSSPSDLARVVEQRRKSVLSKRDEIVADRSKRASQPMSGYAWSLLEQRLTDIAQQATGITGIEIQLDQIDREKYGGDVSLKIPSLLKIGGPKKFISEFQPQFLTR